MVSGSQLQFAKLAQMRLAAPSSAQQHPMEQRRPAVTRVKTWVKTQPRAPSGAQQHRTVTTSAFLEHIILFTSFLKKRQKCPGSGFGSRPESRGPHGALGVLKKMPDSYALFYALFMSEKAGPKKEEFNFNVGISTCKKYIGKGLGK